MLYGLYVFDHMAFVVLWFDYVNHIIVVAIAW